ncbi:MAG TPA: retroviral-like aspartic protease family protein [Thermodesulfovibrionia bacterium]|nr:retroviral-like aspartic protease family protein [Thermodesulfovibrionia bacterium]
MGKITEKVIVKNFGDILMVSKGMLKDDEIRIVEVQAIVDTGAAFLCLPPEIIAELGLMYSQSRRIITANGEVKRNIFAGASITIQGRETQMSVMENDKTTPPLIGYLVLEDLDLVPDTKSQKLIPNPEHDGKWITDLL